MNIDYTCIGKRIAHRRKSMGFTQAKLAEAIGISSTYMSSIERAVSIPSTEVIMRLAMALETTPDEFLAGTAQQEGAEWRSVAELLRPMDKKQLALARSLLLWLQEQSL